MAPDHPLRIAYVFPQFPVDTQVFAKSDIEALRQAGHDVEVFSLRRGGRDVAALAETMGVDTWAIDRPGVPGASLGAVLRRPLSALRMIGKVIASGWRSPRLLAEALYCTPRALQIVARCSDRQVIHAFWGRHPSLILVAAKITGAPALRSVFVGAYDLVRDDFLVRLGLNAARAHFTHSQTNRRFFEDRGIADPMVVPRGIPLDLGTGQTAAPLRDPSRLVTASALGRIKNVHGVIDAFAEVARTRADVSLTIAGDGPDRAALEAQAAATGLGDRVRFTGYVSREALYEYMRAAGVFVFLSRKPSERLPNVLKEAMHAGAWIISAPSEGIEELIPGPEYGQIVSADAPDQIVAAIHAAVDRDAARREADADRTRAWIEDRFSSRGSMAAYVDHWRSRISH